MVDLELKLKRLCAQSRASLLHGDLALSLSCMEKCIDMCQFNLFSPVSISVVASHILMDGITELFPFLS